LVAALAVAVGMLSAPAAAAAADVQLDQATEDRDFVRWLSIHDPRAAVRSPARAALLHSTGAVAITAFLDAGYRAAGDRAQQTRLRQTDYATRMLGTHPVQYYPWVNAGARRALSGTEAELAEFTQAGYAAALQKDLGKVPYDDGAAQVVQHDRDYLADLATTDASDRVRTRAAAAQTDAEVAEFLRRGWLSAAGIDGESFRGQYVGDEWVWWHEARERLTRAQADDQAAREATGEAQGPARAVAAQAWAAVSAYALPARQAWADREKAAQTLADAWLQTSGTAAAVQSPLWAEIAGKAPAVRKQWLSEKSDAAERAAWWTDLYQHALTAEAEWNTPVG
jgi:hypothetical protein